MRRLVSGEVRVKFALMIVSSSFGSGYAWRYSSIVKITFLMDRVGSRTFSASVLKAIAVIGGPQTDPISSSAATPESATEDGGSTRPIVCPRNHPKQFNLRIPARAIAPRGENLNQQPEHATPGQTSTDEESTSAQETSDSDRCPGCVREEMAERARTTGAGTSVLKLFLWKWLIWV